MATVRRSPVLAPSQRIAFTIGALTLAGAALHVLPLSPGQHWAQLATGVAGLLSASHPNRARLFGLLLLVCYGGMLVWDLMTMAQVDIWQIWLPVRMIIAGFVIEVATSAAPPR